MRVWLSVSPLPLDGLSEFAVQAEGLGIFGIAIADHTSIPVELSSRHPEQRREVPVLSKDMVFPNPLVVASYLGSVAMQLRFTTHVLVTPTRHPILLAREVATTAALLGGRLDIGVGLGWVREEYEALGLRYAERGSRLDEMVPLLRRLWTGEPVEHRGQHFSFDALSVRPSPGRPIEILVGGQSEAALRRARKLGDGWVGGMCDMQTLRRAVHRLAVEDGKVRTGAEKGCREGFVVRTAISGQVTQEVVHEIDQLGVRDFIVMPWQLSPEATTVSALSAALPGFLQRTGLGRHAAA